MKYTIEIEWLDGPHGISDEALTQIESALGWLAHTEAFMAADFPNTTPLQVMISTVPRNPDGLPMIPDGDRWVEIMARSEAEVGWTPVAKSDDGGWEMYI